MATFVFTLIVLSLVVAGMSIGILLGRKPISGSCGGMSALGIDTSCDICGGDPNKCEETNADDEVREQKELAYDASRNS
ncbi:(Na+)-NQR maturation NqrM [Aurantivibrio plasticivorans]